MNEKESSIMTGHEPLTHSVLDGVAVAVLKCSCRSPDANDYPMQGIHYDGVDPLARATAVFPEFREVIRDKSVLDFGCGPGYQVAAMADAGARVTGVDNNPQALAMAKRIAGER